MSLESSNIPAPTRDAIVHAVSHRSGESQAQTQVRAATVRAKIQALAPRDALEEMLMGQLVALDEIFAAVTHDLLNGVIDPMRLKGQASLVTIARVTQGHVDRLKRMAKQRASADTPPARIAQPAPAPTPSRPPAPAAVPARNTAPAPAVVPASAAETEDSRLAAIAPGYKRPQAPDSPLDEPFFQSLADPSAGAMHGVQLETPPRTAVRGSGPVPEASNRVAEMVAGLRRQQLAAAAAPEPVPKAAVGG